MTKRIISSIVILLVLASALMGCARPSSYCDVEAFRNGLQKGYDMKGVKLTFDIEERCSSSFAATLEHGSYRVLKSGNIFFCSQDNLDWSRTRIGDNATIEVLWAGQPKGSEGNWIVEYRLITSLRV